MSGFGTVFGVFTSALASYAVVAPIYKALDLKGADNVVKTAVNYLGIGDEYLGIVEAESEAMDSSMPSYSLVSDGILAVDNEKDDEWWKWAFKNRGGKEDGIKDVNELKTKCQEHYRVGSYDDFVWKYCSPMGSKPLDVNDVRKRGYADNFGSSSVSSSLLADRPSNKNAWTVVFDKVFNVSEKSNMNSEFAKVKVAYSKEHSDDNLALNKLCDKFFGTKESELGKNKDDVLKFCVFKKAS